MKEGAALQRPAMYYFSPLYRQEEPRVILLVGRAWRPKLRAHYGISGEAFFCREAYMGEPDHYPNRHPWGWVFRPEKVLEYEGHSGHLTASALAELQAALQAQLAAVPILGRDAGALQGRSGTTRPQFAGALA